MVKILALLPCMLVAQGLAIPENSNHGLGDLAQWNMRGNVDTTQAHLSKLEQDNMNKRDDDFVPEDVGHVPNMSWVKNFEQCIILVGTRRFGFGGVAGFFMCDPSNDNGYIFKGMR